MYAKGSRGVRGGGGKKGISGIGGPTLGLILKLKSIPGILEPCLTYNSGKKKKKRS